MVKTVLQRNRHALMCHVLIWSAGLNYYTMHACQFDNNQKSTQTLPIEVNDVTLKHGFGVSRN